MPILEFRQDTMPSTEMFAELLRSNDERYDPLEELLSLERELYHLEQTYHITSPEFYRQYQAGLTDDSVELVGWIGRYKLYMNLRQAISDSLKLVLTEKAPSLA